MVARDREQRGSLRLDLVDNCNLRCLMCQAYNGVSKSTVHFLDFDQFNLCTQGQLDRWSTIQIGNAAEPTIHPRFGDFLRLVRAQTQATIHVVTNGQLLQRCASVINEAGNCIVQVSIDSLTERNYENIRRGGSFAKLRRNLDLLDPLRANVLIACTLMKSNLSEYESMVSFCQQRKYKMSVFPMILRQDRGLIPYELLDESLWFHLSELKQWLGRFYGNDFGGTLWGSGPGINLANVDAFSCDAHLRDLVVDSRGRATLCSQLEIGNILETSLESVWRSATAEQFRACVEQDRGPCKACDYRERCLNPSFARLENHFSREICQMLSPETKHAIRYDRSIGDEEAREVFAKDIARCCAAYEVRPSKGGIVVHRKPLANPGREASSQEPIGLRGPTLDVVFEGMLSWVPRAEEGDDTTARAPTGSPTQSQHAGGLTGAVRGVLSGIYQRYLRSPTFVRSVLDRPVFLLKRVAARALRPPRDPIDAHVLSCQKEHHHDQHSIPAPKSRRPTSGCRR